MANPGYNTKTDYNISSMAKIREISVGARLDDAFFAYLMGPGGPGTVA
jgi:hypothetical protein